MSDLPNPTEIAASVIGKFVQPIAKAPRDGTHVLTCGGYEGHWHQSYWEAGEWQDADGYAWPAWYQPTHWLPLPEMPRGEV